MSYVDVITEQQRVLLQEIGDLEDQHAKAALALVEAPNDPDVLEALEAIDAKLNASKKRLALFQSALAGAKARDTADEQTARINAAAQARSGAEELAEQRVKVGKAIDAALKGMGDLLGQYDRLNQDINRLAVTVLRSTRTPDHPHYFNSLERASQSAVSRIQSPVAAALTDAAGKGTLDLDVLRRYISPDARHLTVQGVAEYDRDHLLPVLDGFLRS